MPNPKGFDPSGDQKDARQREQPFASAERDRRQDAEADEAQHANGARPEPGKAPGLDGDVVGR